jgi:ring-1,2-phenylacetyl-CoA epoxidase subunit PaaD
MVSELKREQVYDWLQEVKDPEIPAISVVDLGVITEVRVDGPHQVYVEMIPTFSGCPAIQLMKLQIEQLLQERGIPNAAVDVNYNKPWSSNNITERGRQQLLDFGLSPPPAYDGELENDTLEHALCPNCGSTDTQLNSPFGPTLCRALHKCRNCGEAFEQFKPV